MLRIKREENIKKNYKLEANILKKRYFQWHFKKTLKIIKKLLKNLFTEQPNEFFN